MARPPFDPRDEKQITPALARLLGRAVMISQKSSEGSQGLQASFTTILAAFLASDDSLSRWFQGYVGGAGIKTELILDHKSIPPEILDSVRKAQAPEEALPELTNMTDSADMLLQEASRLRDEAGGADGRLDVRHLMGAYIYQPGTSHQVQLEGWGFDREDWSNGFLRKLAALYPEHTAELEVWREEHARTFGAAPEVEVLKPPEEEAGPPEPATPELLADRPGRLAGYDADFASGRADDDLLDISPEVNALAAIIAANTTTPPLAIGVFGDWGAGKTFFMRSLMQRIDQLAKAARGEDDHQQEEELQRKITFYKRIVQIEFNAWHYVEGNLWASLVQHIFANLRISQDPAWDPAGRNLEILQERLLAQLTIQQRIRDEAREEAQEAKQKRDEAQEERQRVETERAAKLEELRDLTSQDVIRNEDLEPLMEPINAALTAAGFGEVPRTLTEVTLALADARGTLQHGGSLLMPLIQAKDHGRRARLLVLSLLAGPAIGLLAGLLTWLVARPDVQETLSQVAGVTTGLAGLLGTLAAWLRSQAQWTSKRLAEIEVADQRLEDLQAEKLVEHDRRIAQLQQEATRLNGDYFAALQREQVAVQRIEEIERQLQQVQPVHALARFIEDRTDSDDYRKHLGLLALIRHDFGILSKYIEDENARLWNADEIVDLVGEKEAEDSRINRIVLYIDDLDRCPPRKVVQVLQAVHLLLAFPLFVVVVGVDARWVSHALQRYYPDLLGDDRSAGANWGEFGFGRDATPHDYLEKIFQIPIWLRPVSADGSRRMLRGLLGAKVTADPLPPRTGAGAGDEALKEREEGAETVSPDEKEVSPGEYREEEEEGDQETGEIGTAEEKPPIDLTPESLEIYRKELAFMNELAPILGRSPRAVKRFVNVYRLVKAALAESDQCLDLTDAEPVGDYQVVMFLLAVVTGAPTISRQFFRTIRDLQRKADQEQLVPNLDSVMEELASLNLSPAAGADRAGLQAWLNGDGRERWRTAPLEPFAQRASQVARYSFRVEQREQ